MTSMESCYPDHDDVMELSVSQRNFARDLYVKLARGSSGNVFFSPFSISTALAMLFAGADGNTKEQMKGVMSLSQENEVLHKAFKNVVADFKNKHEEYELTTSNMLYMSDALSVLSDYMSILKEMYLSSVKTVNFNESEPVRKEINDAVEGETNSRIKDLIPEGVLNEDTRMVLVNAVYFKGLWQNQFEESNTREAAFWTSESEKTMVQMMFIKERFAIGYHEALGATILSLYYKGARLSMVVVLPQKRDGLSEIESKLANMNFSDLEKDLDFREIELFFPKFKLSETVLLKDHLTDMGMSDLFDRSSSDLSGISGNHELFVSHVIQKSFLEVDEKGTEAAAATRDFEELGVPEPVLFVLVDHPFLFYIRDHQSKQILFMGRLTNPTH